MRKMLTTIGALLMGAAAMLTTPEARADVTEDATLRLEPGVAIPVTSPQKERFNAGATLAVKPMFKLTPWLDAGPSFSVFWLPSNMKGTDDGTAWTLGGTLRVKRPRDESNKDTGWKAVSPWVDGDLQYVRTGPLDRVGLALAVGAQVPTSDARTFWIGPFVRYQDVVQGNRIGFDNSDARMLIAGVSLEFGAAPKRKQEAAPCPQTKVEQPAKAVASDEHVLHMRRVVQFKVNSSALEANAKQRLEDITSMLLENKNLRVQLLQIEGHASSEGPPEPYNTNLSLQRAMSILAYFDAAGVAANQMTAQGFSSKRPVASNATNAGRVANRRGEVEVDFVITSNAGASK